jgi:hypothetical protein
MTMSIVHLMGRSLRMLQRQPRYFAACTGDGVDGHGVYRRKGSLGTCRTA